MFTSDSYKIIAHWFEKSGLTPFEFQQNCWQQILLGNSGLVNAPTGFGKTYSVFIGAILQFIESYPTDYATRKNNGLQLLWITPLRALAADIARAMELVISELGMAWKVGIRNGDTSTNERARQKHQMPEILLTTPESLHLLLAMKDNEAFFKTLRIIAVDEWHELMGSKRGVQTELAISVIIGRLKNHKTQVWGISATIGNLQEAMEVLINPIKVNQSKNEHQPVIIQSGIRTRVVDGAIKEDLQSNEKELEKVIAVHAILPDEMETYPWAGHLGIKLAHKLLPIIEKSKSTLLFINTRGMAERWYQTLIDIEPGLMGVIALHHGSIDQNLRAWVEDSLHTGILKVVVCTASLDLGVDFRPVDTVIQVGSPKGVARFLQRAGRAGHQPGSVSHIHFLPTHSLELAELSALKTAMNEGNIESREPMRLCFDVLMQFLCTLAIGGGFIPNDLKSSILNTYCFQDMTDAEWDEILLQLTSGGPALQQYDEFKKIEVTGDRYEIKNRRMAMRHRMHIGTIVSDAMLRVKFLHGGYIGVIEEYFISRLLPGDSFILAGKNLELVQLKDMDVLVRKSTSKKTIVPSWMGSRMSLSANLGETLRATFNLVAQYHQATSSKSKNKLFENYPLELSALEPLFNLQQQLSHIPDGNELLIEHLADKDGFHLLVYPFEGRQVHEALSALLAYRIGKVMPLSFSMAMNDYGFELLSDQPIPLDDTNVYEMFSTHDLLIDMQRSTNAAEMASRKFRDIAIIGGLIFQGMPGQHKKARHLQSSASLLFKVFRDYEPDNILLKQAFLEVFSQQMEEVRLRNALNRISQQRIIIRWPEKLTPLSFPIMVDGLSRLNLSSEKLADRIKRMQEL